MTPEEKAIPPYILMRAYQLGWSTTEIAGAFGLTHTTVNDRLRKYGCPIRKNGGARTSLGPFGQRWIR